MMAGEKIYVFGKRRAKVNRERVRPRKTWMKVFENDIKCMDRHLQMPLT